VRGWKCALSGRNSKVTPFRDPVGGAQQAIHREYGNRKEKKAKMRKKYLKPERNFFNLTKPYKSNGGEKDPVEEKKENAKGKNAAAGDKNQS